MYRAVLFDFDYTLGDSSRGIVASANHALTQLGYAALPPEAIYPTIGLSLARTCAQLTECDDTALAGSFTRLFHEKAEQVMVPSTELYPQTLPMLHALRAQGIRTAIVTTKLRRRIEQILVQTGAQGLFDLVVGAEDVRAEKPSPEGLLWALDHLGLEKQDVLYVGDSLVDAQAAQRAGIPFAAVLTGKTPREAFLPYAPAAIAQDVGALLPLMQPRRKKAFCLVGSARANGSTSILVDAVMDGMRSAGIDAVKHCVSEKDIRFCLGCKRCYETGECVQQDDVRALVAEMLASDYVVIASPSYWADVPGQLKTLFDRTTPYGDTNPRRVLRAKHSIQGIAIAVRAGSRPQENELILNAIDHYFGHLGIKTVKRVSICGVDTPDDLLKHHQADIEALRAFGASL